MWTNIKLLISYMPKFKLFLLIISIIGNALMGLASAVVLQMASKMQGTTNFQQLLHFGLISLFLYTYVAVAMLFGNVMINFFIKDVMNQIESELFLALMAENKEERTNSEKISILVNEMQIFIEQYLSQVIVIPLFAVVFVSPLIYMLTQNIIVGGIFIIGSLSLMLPQILFDKKLEVMGKNYAVAQEKYLNLVSDGINGKKYFATIKQSKSFKKVKFLQFKQQILPSFG